MYMTVVTKARPAGPEALLLETIPERWSVAPPRFGRVLPRIAPRVGARRPGKARSALFEQLPIPIDPIPVAMDDGRIREDLVQGPAKGGGQEDRAGWVVTIEQRIDRARSIPDTQRPVGISHEFDHGLERRVCNSFTDPSPSEVARSFAAFDFGAGRAEEDGVHSADQEAEFGVLDQTPQCAPVRRGHKLHAALCDRRDCRCVLLSADLVDHDEFWRVILDGLQQQTVLVSPSGNLDAAGGADRRVREGAGAADLVAGVHDDHTSAKVNRGDPGHVPLERRLAAARGPEDEQVLLAQKPLA